VKALTGKKKLKKHMNGHLPIHVRAIQILLKDTVGLINFRYYAAVGLFRLTGDDKYLQIINTCSYLK
jgi:hypothetical protein